MTYQIAMIGKDGWVLASDRKMNEVEGEDDYDLNWTTSLTRKIDARQGVVCARSGDPLGSPAEKLFWDSWTTGEFDKANPSAAFDALAKKLFEVPVYRDFCGKRRLIVAIAENDQPLD